jgi:N-acetyl-anhydromuramyl-L-alanine amidase AmpD
VGRRTRPLRVVWFVAAFYALVWAFVASPGARPRLPLPGWKPRVFPAEALPPPVADRPAEPPPFVPWSDIPPLPDSLAPIASDILRDETREWTTIVVHHSATVRGNAAEFDKEHLEVRGWEFGLGYHFVVGNGDGAPAGGVEVGRRWRMQIHGAHAGAGATAYNQHGIGICVVGNYEEAEMKEEVYAGVRDLAVWLARRYAITPDRVLPHKDVRGEPTDCPGKNFPLDRLREDVRQALRR